MPAGWAARARYRQIEWRRGRDVRFSALYSRLVSPALRHYRQAVHNHIEEAPDAQAYPGGAANVDYLDGFSVACWHGCSILNQWSMMRRRRTLQRFFWPPARRRHGDRCAELWRRFSQHSKSVRRHRPGAGFWCSPLPVSPMFRTAFGNALRRLPDMTT